MAMYALIKPIEDTEDFIVDNILVAEPSFVEGKPEYVLFEQGDYVGIGFTYSGGVFTPPIDTDFGPIRLERDRLLAYCDFAVAPDYFSSLSEEDQAAIVAYRQALRDVPQNADLPKDVDWPAPPSFLNL